MRYVAFLRGVNVGGNKKVPMADLKACLEKAGYENVKTLLNSGNVAFDADQVSEHDIQAIIEKQFGFKVDTLVRVQENLQKIVAENPFEDMDSKNFQRYVTFLRNKPINDDPGEFKVLKVTDDAVYWYIDLSKDQHTLDAMTWWDKTFGKEITTRNWNTVAKAAEL